MLTLYRSPRMEKGNRWQYLTHESRVGNIDITIDLSDTGFFHTMKTLEQEHWNYLDTYHNRISFFEFIETVLNQKSIKTLPTDIKSYCKRYDKYKKTLPTAGALIFHEKHILLVNVFGSHLFSLPKGKKENEDVSLKDTAIREVREETGLDITETLNEQNYCHILKTRFYIIETDELISHFEGFNRNEIKKVQWFRFADILNEPFKFSKQTAQAVAVIADKLDRITHIAIS